MRIIKVPTNTLPVRYDDQQPPVTKQENYFWFTVKGLLRTSFRAMSSLDNHKNIEFHDEVMTQDGAAELRINRESDYEMFKGWIDNGKNWPGTPNDTDTVFLAVRDAEKVKAEPKEEPVN